MFGELLFRILKNHGTVHNNHEEFDFTICFSSLLDKSNIL